MSIGLGNQTDETKHEIGNYPQRNKKITLSNVSLYTKELIAKKITSDLVMKLMRETYFAWNQIGSLSISVKSIFHRVDEKLVGQGLRPMVFNFVG